MPQHGSLTGTAPNLTFHAAAGYSGPDAFTFTVDDGMAKSNTATVSITIRPANRAPVANAGGPYVADLGVAIALDATASTDPDIVYGDSLVQYTWTVANTIQLSGATPTLTALQISTLGLGTGTGTHTATLTVTDTHGLTRTAAVPALQPGASFPSATQLTVPVSVLLGDKNIIAVADAFETVAEKDETNNTAKKSVKLKR